MKFQKKYEDPRRIYLKVNETTESKEIMQKLYLAEFRMNDKEKIDKALARIAKIMDEYKKHPEFYGYDVNKEYIDEHFDNIKNELSDSTSSDEMKVKRALAEIYGQLNTLLDMGGSYDQIRDLKKVKSILGQIPALEAQLQQFQRELRQ